jgi:hypothetical protein
VHQAHHVRGVHVRPDDPGLLRVREQPLGGLAHRHPAGRDQLGLDADRVDQRVRQAALGYQVAGQAPHPGAESLPGRRLLQQRVPFPADRAHLAAEHGRLQVEPGGEVPVEGADAYPGAPGDVLQRRVGAPLGERGRSRVDQPGVVLPRVGPQLLGGPRGYLIRCSGHRFEANGINKVAKRRLPPYS